jgi:hypothetical protein
MRNLTRHAADPTLNLLARELRDLVWLFPLDADELLEAKEMGSDANARRRWVSPLPDYKSWAVRMYVGGAQRTVGIYKPPSQDITDISPALRFADMVAMYFWHHKVRGAHEPDDRELNFSVERVKADLVAEENAIDLIKRIEEHLISVDAIVSSADMQVRRSARRDQWRRQRTVSGTVLEVSEVLSTAMQRVESNLGGLMKALEEKMAEQVKEIARLNSMIELLLTRVPRQSDVPNTIPTPWRAYVPPYPPGAVPVHTGDPLPPNPVTICGNTRDGSAAPL